MGVGGKSQGEDATACVTHVGPGGSGHYVKMVHNGIEYADMQFIAEAYDLMRAVGGLSHEAVAAHFRTWNDGRLQSYLFEITADILLKVRWCSACATGGPSAHCRADESGRARVDSRRDWVHVAWAIYGMGGLACVELGCMCLRWRRRRSGQADDQEGEEGYLLDKILDQSGQKGTGKWTVQEAANVGIAVPTISAALEARFLSARKEERVQCETFYAAKQVRTCLPRLPPRYYLLSAQQPTYVASAPSSALDAGRGQTHLFSLPAPCKLDWHPSARRRVRPLSGRSASQHDTHDCPAHSGHLCCPVRSKLRRRPTHSTLASLASRLPSRGGVRLRELSQVQPTPTVGEPLGATEAAELAEALEQALFAAKVCAYAQGFGVIRAASEEYGWWVTPFPPP